MAFSWPIGSKHTLVFITDPLLPGQVAASAFQTSTDGGTVYAFNGWRDNAGLLSAGGETVLTITATPAITSIRGDVTISYRLKVNLFDDSGSTAPPTCGAPGISGPSLRPGVVFIGGVCYWSSVTILVPANSALALNAFPYPGFAFLGWVTSVANPGPFLSSITIN
ncbi:MAG: hypothetical protein M3O35_15320, partial [Acidobacteriota bacterium]|nr:hypothetical protein [Acidobacteriota bacterium]